MLFDPKHEEHLGRLEKLLRRTRAITSELMSDVIAQACTRFAAHGSAAKVRVDRLIEAEAWSDAAIALIDVELPQWKLRRLVHEDGEWSCMLCKHWQLPDWLDDTVEAGHEVLALAILCAFVEACRANSAATESDSHRLPRSRSQPTIGLNALCCDDFA